jgi:hypothetical protein
VLAMFFDICINDNVARTTTMVAWNLWNNWNNWVWNGVEELAKELAARVLQMVMFCCSKPM